MKPQEEQFNNKSNANQLVFPLSLEIKEEIQQLFISGPS
jgi:hypothetical protein